MPSDKRSELRRTTAQAHVWITKTVEKIAKLYEEFSPSHPTHSQLLESIAKGLLFQQQLLEEFARHSWGKFPDNPQKWI